MARITRLILLGFYIFTVSLFAVKQPPFSPLIDPGMNFARQGMTASQVHYTNFVQYTMNLNNPGQVEIGVYNQNINGQIETVPFYRWRAGPVRVTNRSLDFFIDSQQRGFFTIQLPFGIGYTRDGRLKIADDGRLVTLSGEYPVLGQNGEIFINGEDFTVSKSGVIFVDGEQIDKFRISVFKNRDNLVTLNGSFFYHSGGEVDLFEGEEYYAIRQGHLEESNVLKALTGDIGVAKQTYEASSKAIKTLVKTSTSGLQMGAP